MLIVNCLEGLKDLKGSDLSVVRGLLVVVVRLLVVVVVVVGLLLLVVVVVSAVVLGGVTSLVAGLELNIGAVWRTDVTLNLPESLH